MPVAWQDGNAIDADQFAAEVEAFRARLPDARHIINLCDNRFAFLIVFAAALTARRTTLLPPDAGPRALRQLCNRYESVAIVSDHVLPSPLPNPVVHWSRAFPATGATLDPIPADRPAVIVHTSGSTGVPRPHAKTWGMLVRRARAVGERLELDRRSIDRVVATVPSQHMYGIENAILLPIQHGIAVAGARPLFPADVAAASDARSLLVTTPVHLRSFSVAESDARAGLVLSSTAPLSAEQARRAEADLRAPTIEIYGSTEAGVVATRRTSTTCEWRLLDSLCFKHGSGALQVRDEFGNEIEMHDSLELLDNQRFLLGPRVTDIVKVAGKRASLMALSESLRAIPGVEDGVFFLPPGNADTAGRLAAFVVAPELDPAAIANGLRAKIDPIFLPRPLVRVAALPRNATGKLPRATLETIWAETAGRAD